jgi:hypothetical protein
VFLHCGYLVPCRKIASPGDPRSASSRPQHAPANILILLSNH